MVYNTIHYEHGDIKRNSMHAIERMAICEDGTVFGGAVRDSIISQHYITQFRKHMKETKQSFDRKTFWDVSFHPETAARTLVPNDLDIYFTDMEKADNFLQKLHEMYAEDHVNITVERGNDDPSNHPREYGRFLNVQKVVVIITVGRIPLLFHGFDVMLEIDVVTPYYDTLVKPPFGNLDFLCNGFIRNKQGIAYSKCTGTYMDGLTEVERSVEICKIQQDMLQFKTAFCLHKEIRRRSDMSAFHKNKYAFKRISKLLKKEEFSWTVENLPFEMCMATNEDTEHECCVCLQKIELNEKLVFTAKEKKCVLHQSCLMTYLEKQQEDGKERDMSEKSINEFVFRCPFRNAIDFVQSV